MIPKTIYYIWIGNNPKPEIFYRCKESWEKNLLGFDIVEINETNFNFEYHLAHNNFFRECYNRKLWAFVSDYMRVVHLYENGGIYLDTDMQVIKDISPLIDEKTEFLAGFENDKTVSAGIIASKKHSSILKSMLKFYSEDVWNYPLFTIPKVLTYVLNYELQVNKEIESCYVSNTVKILPVQYFYPYAFNEDFSENCICPETYTIHWWNHSWEGVDDNYLFLRTKHLKEPFKSLAKIAIKIKHNKLF